MPRTLTDEEHAHLLDLFDRLTAKFKPLQMALYQGRDMRECQKAYFKSRSKDALIASKEAEKAFDKALAELLPRVDPGAEVNDLEAYRNRTANSNAEHHSGPAE